MEYSICQVKNEKQGIFKKTLAKTPFLHYIA